MNCTQHVLTVAQAASLGVPVVATEGSVVVVGEHDGEALWWSTAGTLGTRLNGGFGSIDWRSELTLPSFTPPALPLSPALTFTGQSNVVVANLRFRNVARAVRFVDCAGVRVTGCDFRGCGMGVSALTSTGVVVDGCTGRNLRRPEPTTWRGHFVQFDKCSGAGNAVTGNRFENVGSESDSEDFVNIFESNGTDESPILVADNILRGGGPSLTGSGIILGDGGGSYITAARNLLINPGQVGIGVAGGSHIIVEDNDAYGEQAEWSNVAFYAWDQSGLGVDDIIVRRNRADWYNSAGARNGWWVNANASSATTTEANDWDATLDPVAMWAD